MQIFTTFRLSLDNYEPKRSWREVDHFRLDSESCNGDKKKKGNTE